jgi:hypothetical protein
MSGARRAWLGLVAAVLPGLGLTGFGAQPTAAAPGTSLKAYYGSEVNRSVGPPTGKPYIVTLGDSYSSGEAGRWAGSSNVSVSFADALGPTAYFDNASGTAESVPGCHRSRSSEAYIGGGVGGATLACSGSRTTTYFARSGDFKPGLDFYRDADGHVGQARALMRFASSHRVAMVVVSIGGNDFDFASVVRRCVTAFLTSPSWDKDLCSDDAEVVDTFTDDHVAIVRSRISLALLRVREAMRRAGYRDAAWSLVVQTYPSPLPGRPERWRYPESGFTRQSVGGCGFWNADARWANRHALGTINDTVKAAASRSGITGTKVLDMAAAYNGRRLCESGVGLYEEVGLTSWRQPGAVDQTEWINQIRTLSALIGPYEIQESLHPNYWGHLALRRCVRKVYHRGVPRSGSCVIGGSGLVNGEPRMRLR